MKRNSYLLLVLFFAGITIFSSCNKDEETPAKPKTELLAGTTSKTWKISNYESSISGVTFSFYNSLPECSKDDITILFTNKNFEEKEGAKKCDSDDTLATGKWSLSSDEKELTMDYDGYKEVFKISEVSDKTLKLEMVDTDEDSKIMLTYTAQ